MKSSILCLLLASVLSVPVFAQNQRCNPPQGVQNQDLFYAIFSRDTAWLKAILESAVSPNHVTFDRHKGGVTETAVMFAADWNEPEALQLLIDFGADVTCTNEVGLTAWDYTRDESYFKKVRQILSNHGLGN